MTATDLPAFRCNLCDQAIGATGDHWIFAGLVHCWRCTFAFGLFEIAPDGRGQRAAIAGLLAEGGRR